MNHNELNEIYEKLDKKAREICNTINCTYRYYNGHYHKNQYGDYEMDFYPIPVISVKGICDIEIDFDKVSVTTKLSKDKAASYDYIKFKDYHFEAYGVENYLDDYFVENDTIKSMIDKIKISKEENIFFSFYFPYDIDTDIVCELINLINKEGFFY